MAIEPVTEPAALMIGPGISNDTPVFYTGCPFEPIIGPWWVRIESQAHYSSLERLFDLLIAEQRNQVVIVNHATLEPVPGSRGKTGLRVPFVNRGRADATGPMIGTLGRLAERLGHLTDKDAEKDAELVDAASNMRVSPRVALRLVRKLAQVRQRSSRWIHIRGCHLGEDLDLSREYKNAFKAAVLSAVRCRMLCLCVAPGFNYSKAELAALSAATPRNPKTRRRTFALPGMPDRTMVLDVQDLDGHTHVVPRGYITRRTEAAQFATVLDREWRDRAHPTRFCFVALWHNDETSYIVQLDKEYKNHLIGV